MDRPADASLATKFNPGHHASGIALAALIIGATGIGFAPILVRISPVEAVASGFWRIFLAMPVFALLMLREQRPRQVDTTNRSRWAWAAILLPGIFFAADMALWNTSVNTTTVANATLLTNISPIFVALFSWLVFKERFTRIFLGGMLLAFIGSGMLMGSSFQLKPENLWGDFLGALSGVFFGSYLLSQSRLRMTYGTGHLMFYTSLVGAPILLFLCWLLGQNIFWNGNVLSGWSILLALALVSHVGGQGLIAYALAHLPATFSAIGLLVQPLVATVVAWIALGESLSGLQIAGAAVVMMGVYYCRVGSRKSDVLPEEVS